MKRNQVVLAQITRIDADGYAPDCAFEWGVRGGAIGIEWGMRRMRHYRADQR